MKAYGWLKSGPWFYCDPRSLTWWRSWPAPRSLWLFKGSQDGEDSREQNTSFWGEGHTLSTVLSRQICRPGGQPPQPGWASEGPWGVSGVGRGLDVPASRASTWKQDGHSNPCCFHPVWTAEWSGSIITVGRIGLVVETASGWWAWGGLGSMAAPYWLVL